VTSYWSTGKEGSGRSSSPAVVDGPRTWNSMAHFFFCSLSPSPSLLPPFIRRVSVSLSFFLLSLSPSPSSPLYLPTRVFLSEDCRCLVTITLSLCNTSNSAAWTAVSLSSYPSVKHSLAVNNNRLPTHPAVDNNNTDISHRHRH
jgi:hypothetical protein